MKIKIDEIWWEGPEDNEDTLCIKDKDGNVIRLHAPYPTAIEWRGLDAIDTEDAFVTLPQAHRYTH